MIGLARTAPLLLCWAGCFGLARQAAARGWIEPDWRLSWLLACVAWGTLVTAVTEGLSVVRQLTPQTVAVTWWVLTGALLGWALAAARHPARRSSQWVLFPWAQLNVRIRTMTARVRGWPFDVQVAWAVVVALALFLGWIALDFPTTTGDSLTYHLARIMHWIQQQAVAHYPTHNCRQNELQPWAEYALTHLHLLWGNDRLVNLVQWFAMVSSLIGGTWIAQQLLRLVASSTDSKPAASGTSEGGTGLAASGSDAVQIASSGTTAPGASVTPPPGEPPASLRLRLSALTALLIVSLPIGIVEAVTTQNDYVTTLWLVCLTGLALALIRAPRHLGYLVAAGLAFGLGTLTKATMLLYAAPLLTGLAGWFVARRLLARFLIVVGLTFLLINAGHMARTYALVGSPLAGPYIHKLVRNDTVSLGGTWSNFIRNLALDTPTPFVPVNRAVNRLLAWLHSWSGRGLNDPDITYELCLFSWSEHPQIYDSQASNPLHLLAIGVALIVLVCPSTLRRSQNRPCAICRGDQVALRTQSGSFNPTVPLGLGQAPQAWALAYAALFMASFVLLCALLRWQEWNSRLHLAYFVVLMPWVAVVFLTRLPAWATGLTMLLAVAQASYVVARNESRPLLDPTFTQVPREQQYMAIHMPHRISAYLQACDALARAGVRHLGLKLQYADFEYPLWVMLRNRGFTGRIDHVYVEDVSAKLQRQPPRPEVVLTTFNPPPAAVTNDFPRLRSYGYVTLCWPAPTGLPR